MAAILLAGAPGAGKSTISEQLRDRQLRSIDLDFGYARHEDENGSAVTYPDSPSLAWLNKHRWNWDPDRLTSALADCAGHTAVLAGTAYNMFSQLDRFDLVILLHIDEATLETRLADPKRNNIFGRTADEVAWSLSWRRTVETELRQREAHVIDARQPVDQVVDDVIHACAINGHPIGQLG
ncbi:AAA family ATPase [Kribbella sp. NPDC049174]|uniref:AAA family ATPase n=1 Tax=Kribbella sp. NPDC049174 TaxID=3364112 RepID=UPI003710B501